jgi:hypothetical protein
MTEKAPRPATPSGAHRAGTRKSFADASASANRLPEGATQGGHFGPIAWAHIVVTRLGHVAIWIPSCPFCRPEHLHGGYKPYDIRQPFAVAGGLRGPHCHQAPERAWPEGYTGDYRLVDTGTPARFAPGASRSRAANATLAWLKSIGVPTAAQEIASMNPKQWWRK